MLVSMLEGGQARITGVEEKRAGEKEEEEDGRVGKEGKEGRRERV